MIDQNEANSRTIGEVLRGAREASGMSTREVGRKLKLPSSVVATIESGRLDQLAPIYRRGYVFNYARLLGVDTGELCEHLDREDNQPPELREVLQVNRGAWRFERYLRVATYVFTTAFIAIPLIWIFVKVSADFFESSDSTANVLVAENQKSEDTRVSLRLERLAQTLGDLAGDDQPDSQHLSASTMPILNLLSSSAPREVAPESGIGPLRESPLSDFSPLVESDTSELVLHVGDSCWVEITDAVGRRVEYNLLRPGRHVYRGAAPFEVMLGKAADVSITLDGNPVNFSGYIRANVARFEVSSDGSIRS